jgi:hypothetical protein
MLNPEITPIIDSPIKGSGEKMGSSPPLAVGELLSEYY